MKPDIAYDAGFKASEPRDWHGKWSKFAEEAKKSYLEKHPRTHSETVELIEEFDEWVEDAKYFVNERDWYNRHKSLAKKLFRDKEPIFEKILAATSINEEPKANLHNAVLAMEYYLTHNNSFEGYTRGMGIIKRKLKEITELGEVVGPKIRPFSKNLQGNWEVVTVDRWMRRLFFKHPIESGGKRQEAQNIIVREAVISMAKSIGWKPAELQAVLWNASRYHGGDFNFNLEDFGKYLEQEKAGIEKFLDGHNIAHDAAKPPSKATIALAKMFLRLTDMTLLLVNEIRKFTGDAGFNPSEPRDYHGRWSISSGIDGLKEHVTLSKLEDLSDDPYREAKREFGATDTKELDSKGRAAVNGIIEAFGELQERGLYHPGDAKDVKFIFADFDDSKKGIAMMTGHDNGEHNWIINTNSFDTSVKKIKDHDVINFPQEMALKFLQKNPHATDEDILRIYFKGCMEHEYAHFIDNIGFFGGKHSPRLRDFFLKELRNPYDFGELGLFIASTISLYATAVIPEETFAEGFVRWLNDPKFYPKLKWFYDKEMGLSKKVSVGADAKPKKKEPIFEPYPNPKYIDKDGHVIPDKRWAKPEAAKDRAYQKEQK